MCSMAVQEFMCLVDARVHVNKTRSASSKPLTSFTQTFHVIHSSQEF